MVGVGKTRSSTGALVAGDDPVLDQDSGGRGRVGERGTGGRAKGRRAGCREGRWAG